MPIGVVSLVQFSSSPFFLSMQLQQHLLQTQIPQWKSPSIKTKKKKKKKNYYYYYYFCKMHASKQTIQNLEND